MPTLYQNLLSLTQHNEAFYFKDYVVEGDTYRVFNYRLASYTDFLEQDALEARGITFHIPKNDSFSPICVSRPWKKFFNLGECPFTIGLDLSQVKKMALKEDGSMIATWYNPITKKFGVKSKQDFYSDQSVMATKFLEQEQNQDLREDLIDLAMCGYTVIMELISPANRIVIAYPATELRILGIRNTETGEVIFRDSRLLVGFPDLKDLWVNEDFPTIPEFISSVPSQTGLEGYVFTLEKGLMVKIKTDWYKALHHLKDSVNSPSRLFEAIILETVDDVKTMFPDDEFQLKLISEMEAQVIPKYNNMVKTVEEFYESYKCLARKDFAIKGQKELGMLFTLAMNKYTGKASESAYKDYAIKHRREYFGINAAEEVTNLEL